MIGYRTERSPVLIGDPVLIVGPVLIVDDDELARYALASLLRQWGIDVICALTPDDAHRARACAVIVSELRLTGQTAAEGQALLEELRRRRPASPIVIFSSFLTTNGGGEAIDGTAASLSKRTPLPEVAAVIRALLRDQQRSAAESVEP